MPWQMRDETNKTSSYNDALAQFHINVLKIVMLSCFKKSMKLKKSCCFGFNLDDLPYKIRAPLATLHVQIMVFDNKP